MINRDSNFKPVYQDVRLEALGRWGANVWLGHGMVTDVRRYYYTSRKNARQADISDEIGQNGRVA